MLCSKTSFVLLGLAACTEPMVATTSESVLINPADCIVVAPLTGDFELVTAPASDVLMVSNVGDAYETPSFGGALQWNGLKQLRLSRLDRTDGHLLSQQPIADDYAGNGLVNGPEFAFLGNVAGSPVGLGVLYTGLDGIRGVWRPASPAGWNDFSLALDGTPLVGRTGVVLPSSIDGGLQFPPPAITGSVPLGLSSYGSFVGFNRQCAGSMCYGDMNGGPMVDLAAAAGAEDITIFDSTAHPTEEGRVFVQGCGTFGPQPICGVFEAALDGTGGLLPADGLVPLTASFSLIGTVSGTNPEGETLRLGVVPASGGTLVAMAYDQPSDRIRVWKRVPAGAAPSGWGWDLVGDVGTAGIHPEHFRPIASDTELLLDFQVRTLTATNGAYAVTIKSTTGTAAGVTASAWKQYSPVSHSEELLWMPEATPAPRWAAFAGVATDVVRCWVDPVTP